MQTFRQIKEGIIGCIYFYLRLNECNMYCRTSKKENMMVTKRNRMLAGWTGHNRHRTLFFPKKKWGNINKTQEKTTMILVIATKSGSESQLRKVKVLEPLMSVVLNGNHLVICAH